MSKFIWSYLNDEVINSKYIKKIYTDAGEYGRTTNIIAVMDNGSEIKLNLFSGENHEDKACTYFVTLVEKLNSNESYAEY